MLSLLMAYDVQLDAGGDIPIVTSHITGRDLTLQRLRVRYQTFFGEWILDKSKGVPWLEWLQTKPVNVSAIVAKLRAEATDCPGVDSVSSMSGTFNRTSGVVSITGELVIAGDVVRFDASTAPASETNQSPMALFFTAGPIGVDS